jgi:hypothetical protein
MKTIKEYKQQLIETLEDAGIPDISISIKEPKESKEGLLGWYRNMSQFGRSAIIYIDINAHEKALEELNSNESVAKVIMDTLLHEYGHVIEEFITIDSRRKQDKTFLDKIKENFSDMEDFAELFAKYINDDVFIKPNQVTAMKEVIDYYRKELFTEKAIEWVSQPRWKRELDTLMTKFQASNEKLKTSEGSFNKCLATTESLYERFSKNADIQILRLEGYKGNLDNAHPKWQKFKNKEFIVHYVLKGGDTIIDLTARQFDSKEDYPKYQTVSDLSKVWNEVEVFKTKTSQHASRLKM